ncbi:hypothetical protein [Acinetobacter venetianus]|uniref:hypothetical protein n=1 Tax=Acinetobacter venetianus TaxID=52133 RepID=UPI0021500D22|nr:hypothetical protein [Acinetobacter venetianus]MCR4532461.1 hypothetical protein [Acinetobacter venetianus]
MKYAVSTGNTVEFGVAKKSGNETIVTMKTFTTGEIIDFDDKAEIKRLLEAGVIRPLEHQAEVEVEGK